jgi:hypothetical protein
MTDATQAAGHRNPPLSPSPAEVAAQALSRLTELVRTSMQTQASLTRKSVDLAWSTVVGGIDRTSANRAFVESVTRESARYWRTVGELGVDYASDLLILGKSASTTVFRGVSAAGRLAGSRRTVWAQATSAPSGDDLMAETAT